MINILYVIWSLGLGGAEQVVISLARGLDKSKFQPFICCLNGEGRFAEELKKEGIQVFALNKVKGIDFSVVPKLVRIIRENNINVVHTHLWGANFWGRFAANAAKVPVVITEHNVDVWKSPLHFLIDRFLFKLIMGYPEYSEEEKIMSENMTLKKFEEFDLKPIISPGEILKMQAITKKVYLDDKIKKYILNIVRKTRTKDFKYGNYIGWGCSPRASIGLFIASKAKALMDGRNFVIPSDVRDVAHNILRHRIILTYRARAEGIDSDKIIDEILDKENPL